MNHQQFDVVVVPFPFTDRPVTKKRPALVISDAGSFGDRIGHAVLAMIISAKNTPWPLWTWRLAIWLPLDCPHLLRSG
jgi:mRNA interferase MazF